MVSHTETERQAPVYSARVVERAVDLLVCLSKAEHAMGVTELATQLELNKRPFSAPSVRLSPRARAKEAFVKAAIETTADAILVSSLYGHGEIDAKGLREKCVEAGLQGIKL